MSNQLTASDACAGCNKALPNSEFMRCFLCKSVYDLECINISAQRFYSFYKLDKKRRDAWKCPECQNRKPKTSNQNTPVRPNLSPEQSSNVTHRVKSTLQDISDISAGQSDYIGDQIDDGPVDPATELKGFWEEMRAVRTEMSMFRSVMSDLTAAIKAQNSRLDTLECRVENLEAKMGDGLKPEAVVTKLEETIAQLKLEIDERDQDMLGNDIEIASFPETNSENSTHVLLTVAKKLGVQIEERDVVSAQRVGAPRPATEGGGTHARPRPIAVRLARRSQRDALLQAARVRRHLTTEDINLPPSASPRPFYVNERLTRHNRQLFQKTRELANQLSWKYVWTRDGKIFARQENGKARYRLRSEADFIRVFGVNAVGDTKSNTE